ncbi:MAG TPA: hypothetical protein VK002_09520 [Rubricoccaceae bacterium]|nr:hypothetical protein [Rubricoccaceae bacterium]
MTDPVPPPPPAAAGDTRRTRLREALIAVAVMVVVAVVFYFVGRMQGREPLPALESRVEASEAQLVALRDRALLHEALALTYRTTVDLDARNFGTANERLRAAARALDGLSGVDGTEVDELRRAMAETDLTVSADLAQQRAQVLLFAEEIEALLQNQAIPGAPAAAE